MRWFSTVESADNLEFSVLAAIESLAAVCLSLWLAWHFQTATHILVAACLAPFLLLRTEESTERGLRWFDKFMRTWWGSFVSSTVAAGVVGVGVGVGIEGIRGAGGVIVVVILIVVVIVGWMGAGTIGIVPSLVFKFAATLWTFIQSPIHSLRNIPANWFGVVFCVDSRHPPELLPGMEHTNNMLRFEKWFDMTITNLQGNDWSNKFLGGLWLLLTPFLFLPALAYRWSLKSSSIIWLPLIWVIGWKREMAETANQQLQIDLDVMRHTAWAKLMMAYSLFVIVIMTGLPLTLKGEAIHLKETLNPAAVNPMINNLIDYFLAFQMEAWHWSRLGASVLTLVLFFYADKLLRERLYRPQAGLGFAPPFIRFVTLVRVPLSLFTIACGLYLLASPIDWTEMWRNMQWLPFEWGEGK